MVSGGGKERTIGLFSSPRLKSSVLDTKVGTSDGSEDGSDGAVDNLILLRLILSRRTLDGTLKKDWRKLDRRVVGVVVMVLGWGGDGNSVIGDNSRSSTWFDRRESLRGWRSFVYGVEAFGEDEEGFERGSVDMLGVRDQRRSRHGSIRLDLSK